MSEATEMQQKEPRKGRYHHGELKAALIEAATRFVGEGRLEDFSVADAARAAGVSSGAPYRHFKDRDDLIAHVAAAGFDALSERIEAAVAQQASSIDAVIAGGCAYVEFGAARPELFHLMWSSARVEEADLAREHGHRCYDMFMETVYRVIEDEGLTGVDPFDFADPMWAMVHGFAGLMQAGTDKFDEDGARVEALIGEATRSYIKGVKARRASSG